MEPAQTWLSEPDRLLHIAASCLVFYVYVVALTRISGKRTTGNMNNFDWIITVAIGSVMASGILLRNVSMVDALVAVAALAALQWLTTWAALRSRRFARLVKPQPRVLLENGQFLPREMAMERVTEDELSAAMRRAGLRDRRCAAWIVMETNGQLSVIPATDEADPPRELLSDVAK